MQPGDRVSTEAWERRLFSFTRALPLSLLMLAAVGAAMITLNSLCNSLVQALYRTRCAAG